VGRDGADPPAKAASAIAPRKWIALCVLRRIKIITDRGRTMSLAGGITDFHFTIVGWPFD